MVKGFRIIFTDLFVNFLIYGLFCPDWTVGGRDKNEKKLGAVYFFIFFIKKNGSEDEKKKSN